MDKKVRNRLFIVALAAIGIVVVAYAVGLFDLFFDRDRLQAFVEDHKAYAIFIFVGLQVVQVLVAFLPGEVTGFVGGILFGPIWGVVFSTIGLALGSWIAFNLARLFGRPIVDLMASQETIRRYNHVMKHRGLFLSLFLFLLPGVPKDFLCYLLGLSQIGQIQFLIVSTVGRLLGTTLLTVGGSLFRDERYAALLTIVGITVGILLLALAFHSRIERSLRGIHAAQRLKAMREKRRLSHKERDAKK